MKNLKYTAYAIIFLLIMGGITFAYVTYNNAVKRGRPVVCTMEAKICPDGTAVGRQGPNCEFAACPEAKQGIRGIAMLGPMCPVERIPPDPNCADKPYKTDLMATSPDGTQIFQKFSSDDNGKFSVDLASGEYIITSSDTAKMFSRCRSEGSIKVEKGIYANITLRCDTGIR